MLVIRNIKIQFDKRVVPFKIKKVEVGYKDSMVASQRKYRQTDSHTFQWHQDITHPLYYNIPLTFRCHADQTNFNPEDANSELLANVKIVDYRASTQEGVLLNKQGKKIANLSFSYRVSNQKMVIPEEKGVAVISSILAHVNHQSGSSGYIEISQNNKQIFTPTVKVIAGELLWADELILPIEEMKHHQKSKYQIVFKIYIDEKISGKGTFEIDSLEKNNVKYKKFDIVEPKTEEKLGTLFIDIVIKVRTVNQNEGHNQSGVSRFLQRKRHTQELLLSKRQPSQNFFNSKNKEGSQKNLKIPAAVISSRSQSKLASYNAEATAKILQKYGGGAKKKKNYDLFQGIFNYGQLKKEDNIRQLLRDRRKKGEKESSLPKLK